MRLHIFQSDNGDCILLETSDGHHVLCDGGRMGSMGRTVRTELAKLRDQDLPLDVVYVSHIDSDHIGGVLQILRDELEWRIHDHHAGKDDVSVREPKVPRPPRILNLWHNAFRDLIKDNKGEIEDLLAAAAPACFAMNLREWTRAGEEMQRIATSIPEALEVSSLASADLLGIPLNVLPGRSGPGPLLFVRDRPETFQIGSSRWTLVGPTAAELELLRTGWDNWLRSKDNRARVRKIRAEMRRRVEEFASGHEGSPFDLREWNGVPDFEGVTPPNVASLMFLVEDDGRRVLFTGDSQQDIILQDLRTVGLLDDGHLHVDVLKVQHHGSEHNVDAEFCRRVSADHYVFCGNGENGNPEPKVLDTIFKSRIGPASRRALAPEATGRPFTFWFSTNSGALQPGSRTRNSFEKAEDLVGSLVARSGGRMKAFFNEGPSITLTP